MRRESGYSLVEVMASIVILALAILPMVGMFDMGLKSATRDSNYDKSRALANLMMEEAKSRPYDFVQHNFPVTVPATDSTPDTTSGYYDSGFVPVLGPASADFTNFQYRIQKQYMRQPSKAPGAASEPFQPCDPASTDPTIACSPGTGLIRVTVTVQWADGNEYTTYGLVSA
jgi:prepilin-type N-terminal cleavage/methylation domain-containing protein